MAFADNLLALGVLADVAESAGFVDKTSALLAALGSSSDVLVVGSYLGVTDYRVHGSFGYPERSSNFALG